MEVHSCSVEAPCADDWGPFERSPEHRKQTGTSAELRGVRAVALRGCVQAVDCSTDVFPLRNLDAVGEDLDGQRLVGHFLSIRIQLGRAGVAPRSHLLCTFPSRRSSVHLQAQKRRSGVCRDRQTGQHVMVQHLSTSPHVQPVSREAAPCPGTERRTVGLRRRET